MKNILTFIISVGALTISYIFWKISALQVAKLPSANTFLTQLTNHYYLLGWLSFLFGTFLWIYLLGVYPYSKIYPIFVSACIILSLITGALVFQETSGMLYKVIGVALIIGGAILVSRA